MNGRFCKRSLTLALALMGVLTIAAANTASAVTYGNGFKWTFWDPQNTASSDWVDMIKGRTAPTDTGYWAPNPGGDAASISDPTNAGKWSGTGTSSVWSVVGSANISPAATTLGTFAPHLASQGYGWSIAGLWSIGGNQYGNSGLFKDGSPDGSGAYQPKWVEAPGQGEIDPGIAWLAFQAPVSGDYSFNYVGWAGLRAYKDTELIQGRDLSLVFTTHMNAGQYVYIRSMGSADGSGWTSMDLYTVTANNVVPEPSSMLALLCGIPAAIGFVVRKRK